MKNNQLKEGHSTELNLHRDLRVAMVVLLEMKIVKKKTLWKM